MDRRLADTYLKQWSVWSCDELKTLDVKSAGWQMLATSGYSEEKPSAEIKPGDDATMCRVDMAVARVTSSSPTLGRVLKDKYFLHRTVRYDDLNSALLRFISAWHDTGQEVA